VELFWLVDALGGGGVHSAEGNLSSKPKIDRRIRKTAPNTRKVFGKPSMEIIATTAGAVIKADRPNPITVSPSANPLLSGNHLPTTAMGGLYAKPHPVPAINPKPTIVIKSVDSGNIAIA